MDCDERAQDMATWRASGHRSCIYYLDLHKYFTAWVVHSLNCDGMISKWYDGAAPATVSVRIASSGAAYCISPAP